MECIAHIAIHLGNDGNCRSVSLVYRELFIGAFAGKMPSIFLKMARCTTYEMKTVKQR